MTGKLHSAPHTREEAGATAEDGAPVILHPLVVLNVSDHFTRFAALQNYPSYAAAAAAASEAGASASLGGSACKAEAVAAAAASAAAASTNPGSGSGAGGMARSGESNAHHMQQHQEQQQTQQQLLQQQQQNAFQPQPLSQGSSHGQHAGSDDGPDAAVPLDAAGNPRVVGILLGTARGRVVEVCHSFELPISVAPGQHVAVDENFLQTRLEQYRQIFAQYNVVGWYCTGVEVGDEEHRLHTSVFSALTEAPILLFMNPAASAGARAGAATAATAATGGGAGNACDPGGDSHISEKESTDNDGADDGADGGSNKGSNNGWKNKVRNDLIVTLQLETKVVDDAPRSVLQPVAHRYASEDSERIAVDHVMRHAVPGGADGTSSTTLHLGTLRRSVSMLRARLNVLVAFLEATVNGKVAVDHALLRQVAGVCARLPALDCDEFAQAFADEKSDSHIVTYLGGVTKSLCSLSDAVDMFTRVNTRASAGSMGRRRNPFMRV